MDAGRLPELASRVAPEWMICVLLLSLLYLTIRAGRVGRPVLYDRACSYEVDLSLPAIRLMPFSGRQGIG
jgi:hypothetical protein